MLYGDRILAGTLDKFEQQDPVLKTNQLGIEYPEGGLSSGVINIKIGDGIHKYSELPYAINMTNILDRLEKLEKRNKEEE